MGWWPFSKEKPRDWNASLNAIDWEHYREPRNVIPVVGAAMATYVLIKLHRMYLQRISGAAQIRPDFFRRRSLLGRVTSVGDGDNFHLFHTPGGRLAGWEWLRQVPKDRKALKGRTIPVRIAGIDAPEGAHFGRPAQPYSAESLTWLQNYILGRRVRAYIYKRDQYDRVVATVYVRKGLGLVRKDVGFEMVKVGLATTYEAKTGAEFGGPIMEKRYKEAEANAKARKTGLWAQKKGYESPRDYKTRMAELEKAKPRSPQS